MQHIAGLKLAPGREQNLLAGQVGRSVHQWP